jgi:murein DD-endopeptidase MepM/ murein hydrolase activator NlpD
MPHRSGSYYRHHHSQHAQPARSRAHSAAVVAHLADYTLTHAGRQVRIGPVAFWIVVGTLVIMAAWTLTTATYFAFRDDVLTRLIARQAEMQFAYEDRIAELRAQVDRISSRQLLDQDQYEQKLDQILRRQAALESRATALSTLPDPTVTGSIRPAVRGDSLRSAPLRVTPATDGGRNAPSPDRMLRKSDRGTDVDATLARLQASLDRVEARQGATLNTMEESYDARARRIRSVLGEVGFDTSKIAPPAKPDATGGPFFPARLFGEGDAFERQIQRVSVARTQLDRLTRTLVAVPLRKPVAGEVDLSSGFGMRIDPFVRTPAMHTGLDFRSDTGDPIRATANGTVTVAGWQGGYGRMVEIDHGNGFSTRYGHMSAIEVSVGQAVKIGQVVGRVGSTGRSTGPHLHYETRIDGEAVDPQKFLRAGAKLGHL